MPTEAGVPARQPGAASALLAAISLGLFAACQGGAGQPGGAHPMPLVVVAVDGLEWRLVDRLREDGGLPELGALEREGLSRRLETLAPAISPRLWTSMATGVVPERHGIVGFARPSTDPPGAPRRLFTSRERRVKALWNIADEAGLDSCVIGYWATFPVEAVRGVMVAQTALATGRGGEPMRKGRLLEGIEGQVHPADYEARAFDLLRRSAADVDARARNLFGDTSPWPPAMKRLAAHSRWSLAADAAYQRIALDLLSEPGRCDLLIVYLGLPDVLGHRFWRWTEPGDYETPPPADEVRRFGDVLPRAYGQVDAFVGQVRRSLGPRAAVVVVSDHGMGAFRPSAAVDLGRGDGRLLRTGGHSSARDAMLLAAGRGIVRDGPRGDRGGGPRREGSILDVAPTLLALLGLPRGRDMDGRTLGALLSADVRAAVPAEVATHTPEGWAAARRLAGGEPPAAGRRLRQLRGLGYLD